MGDGQGSDRKVEFFQNPFFRGRPDSRTEVRFGGTRGSDWGDKGGGGYLGFRVFMPSFAGVFPRH